LNYRDLDSLYESAISKDDKTFSEMKSNVLLDVGRHYSKQKSKFNERVRQSRASDKAKIRLTKNYIHSICRRYENSIVSLSPGTTVMPHNEDELQDKKDAELSDAVWKDIRYRHKFEKKVDKLAKHFIVIGSAWIKIDFNENKGDLIGYEGSIEQVAVDGVVVEERQVIDKEKPVFSGDFDFEIIEAYNVFMDTGAETPDDAIYIGLRKMSKKKDLIELLKENFSGEELKQKIGFIGGDCDNDDGNDEEDKYNMLDMLGEGVVEKHGRVYVREFFFRPSPEFPEGKYFLISDRGILLTSNLMQDKDGKTIFPILNCQFDSYPGSSRGFSIIKQLRPVQAEINRTASKIAETQILWGDDKIITQFGEGMSEGAKLPGMREIKVKSGLEPKVIQGRAGDQFFSYLDSQIAEIYRLAMIKEMEVEKGQQDILASLYSSLKDKKAFSLYAASFERFLIDITEVCLRIAKTSYRDEMLIRAVGRSEAINIAEFRETDPMNYSIKIEPVSGDIDSIMGKYIQSRDLIQYAGGNLDARQIGVIARDGMSFINRDIFTNIIDSTDVIESMILQLDRGEMPLMSEFDDNEAIVDALVKRMKKNDYKYITSKNQTIHANYMEQYRARAKILNRKMEELKEAQNGLIPMDGNMVKVDMYNADGDRVKLPQKTVEWVMEKAKKQKVQTEFAQDMPEQAQIDILSGVGKALQ